MDAFDRRGAHVSGRWSHSTRRAGRQRRVLAEPEAHAADGLVMPGDTQQLRFLVGMRTLFSPDPRR